MQHQGFDYAYDKRLYDRLRDRQARPVREHLLAGLDYQAKLARFMENHDEPQAAATFEQPVHEAAAIITYLSPGLRFFHHGQFEGRRKRISPHLVRAPLEPTDTALQQFYEASALCVAATGVSRRRMAVARVHAGVGWKLDRRLFRGVVVEGRAATAGWLPSTTPRTRANVTCACRFRISVQRSVRFEDLMGGGRFDRENRDLDARGLYLDVPAWGYHVFDVTALGKRAHRRRPAGRGVGRSRPSGSDAVKRNRDGGARRSQQEETGGSAGGSSSPRRSARPCWCLAACRWWS